MERVPDSLIAGDTWTWARVLSEYPGPTWTATVYFERTGSAFSAAATASTITHTFTVARGTTAGYAPGEYRWRLAVDNGTVRYTLESGRTTVLPDPASTGTLDTREHARKVLEAIEAYLEDRSNISAAGFTVGGRSLNRYPIGELLTMRDKYKVEVSSLDSAERAAAGLGSKRRAFVRFGRA